MMEWLKNRLELFICLVAMEVCCMWMNSKFNDLDKRLMRIELSLYLKGLVNDGLEGIENKINGRK